MEKLHLTRKMGMVLLAMCLLWLVACKRDQLQPPTPSILNSYRGTDKMVLQVIETLKEPDNKSLLAELEKQGSINWEYQALITSRFLEGITLRFAAGSNGDYLDAEVNAETKAIGLFSKQQQQQRDAMAQQAFSKRPGLNSTQAGMCTFKISFDIELDKRDFLIDFIFVRYLIPDFYGRLKANGFQITPDSEILTLISEKTTAEVEAMLIETFDSVFLPKSPSDASFTRLEIENSCESVEGDNPNVSPILSIQEVPPTKPIPFGRYGAVDRERIEIVIGCYKDGNVWRAVLKNVKGYYAVKAALLYGVKEVTGIGGNTMATNYCQQITDLKALGFDENLMPTQWYMLGAVWAHERVHVNSLLPSLSQSITEIKANLYNVTVPFTGQSYSIAKNQINDLVRMFLIEEIALGIWISNHNDHAGIEHRGGATEQAELNFMRPMIYQICGYAMSQFPIWPNCKVCP